MRILLIFTAVLWLGLECGAAAQNAPAPDAKASRTPAMTSGTLSTMPNETNQGGEASAAGDDATESFTLNLMQLLSDPLASRPELRWLQERRAWAAHHATGPAQVEQVAREFEAKEAFYPALEMLWLADKMTADPAVRKRLNDHMAELQKKKEPVERDVDAAVQKWGGGKPMEAIEQLHAIRKAHPYNEMAYLKIGFLYLQSYRTEEGKSEKLLVPTLRAKIFRLCYEMFASAMVIDPLLPESYGYLNQIRELLPDQLEFLKQTKLLANVALNFRTALAAIGRLDEGQRDAKTLEEAADGLLGANQLSYAALLFRAALQQPSLGADDAARLTGKLNQVLERLPKEPASAAEEPPLPQTTPAAVPKKGSAGKPNKQAGPAAAVKQPGT